MVPDAIAGFVRGGTSILVATRDARLEPHGARGWAVALDDDRQHATVFVQRAAARRLLADLAHNGRIAVALTRPTDHRAYQIKGIVVGTRAARASERQFVESQVQELVGELVAVGIPPVMVRNWRTWPCVAVRFRVTELFDQTPGPRAGARLA